MSSATESILSAKAQLGVACRYGDEAAQHTARRALTEAKLTKAVEEALAAAPRLTAEQRDRVAHLLLNGGAS